MSEELEAQFQDYYKVMVRRMVWSGDYSIEGSVNEEGLNTDIWAGISQFAEKSQPPKLLVDFSDIPPVSVVTTSIIDILGYYLDDIQAANGSGILLGLDNVVKEAFELIGLVEGKKNPNGYKAA